MTTAADVAAVLDKARRSGDGWTACCPAHDDRNPSLSITDSGDKVLVHCHAGCDQKDVLAAIEAKGMRLNGAGRPDGPPDTHGKHGRASAVWDYYSASGEHVGRVLRFDQDGGKVFSQVRRDDSTWTWKAMPEPRPLYRLRELQRRPDDIVLVCEGEKAADAAQKFLPRLVSVSWAGGCKAVSKADWTPLNNRTVILWPDHDEPGRQAMHALAAIVATRGATIRMVDLAAFGDIPDGWDAADATPAQQIKFTHVPYVREPLALPTITLSDISGGTYAPTRWMFHGLLPCGAFLWVGRPKIGKSLLLLQMATAAGRGFDFLDHEAEGPMAGLLILAEDTDERVQRRVHGTQTVAPSNVMVWTRKTFGEIAEKYSSSMSLPEFLDRYLQQNPSCRFIVLDTEETCRAIWEGEKQEKDTRRITQVDYSQTRGFDTVAMKHRVHIALVNHTRKQGGGKSSADPHELINRTNVALAGCSGSLVLTNYPDADPLDTSDKRRLIAIRGRDIDHDLVLAVEHQQDGTFKSLGPYSSVRQTDLEEQVLKAIETLGTDNPGEFVTYQAIADEIGCSRPNVKRAVRQMKDNNRTVWKGRRLYVKPGRDGGARLEKIEE
jgi:hypothetical protein